MATVQVYPEISIDNQPIKQISHFNYDIRLHNQL